MQSGHRLPALTAEEDEALATTPADDLLSLVRWAKRGARLNCINPGIFITPLARDELTGPRGEIAALAALLMGHEGAFIPGSDFLIDGGVTASWFYATCDPREVAEPLISAGHARRG